MYGSPSRGPAPRGGCVAGLRWQHAEALFVLDLDELFYEPALVLLFVVLDALEHLRNMCPSHQHRYSSSGAKRIRPQSGHRRDDNRGVDHLLDTVGLLINRVKDLVQAARALHDQQSAGGGDGPARRVRSAPPFHLKLFAPGGGRRHGPLCVSKPKHAGGAFASQLRSLPLSKAPRPEPYHRSCIAPPLHAPPRVLLFARTGRAVPACIGSLRRRRGPISV